MKCTGISFFSVCSPPQPSEIKWCIPNFLFYEGDSDDELLDEEPELDSAMLNHTGVVNRIQVRARN